MEPQSASSAQRLERFTNVSGTINFHSWKQIFIASINAKGLEHSLQAQDVDGLTAPKLLTANKADATLMFELLSNMDKEPRQWAILNHPITEQHIQWAGFSLWQAIKKRYDAKAIPQEIFILKLQILNTKCNANAKAYIMDIQESRKRLFQRAGGEMNKEKADIFD